MFEIFSYGRDSVLWAQVDCQGEAGSQGAGMTLRSINLTHSTANASAAFPCQHQRNTSWVRDYAHRWTGELISLASRRFQERKLSLLSEELASYFKKNRRGLQLFQKLVLTRLKSEWHTRENWKKKMMKESSCYFNRYLTPGSPALLFSWCLIAISSTSRHSTYSCMHTQATLIINLSNY